MTRMTSDIESLSQLFQEGLVNLAVQALTAGRRHGHPASRSTPQLAPDHPRRRRAGDARPDALVPVRLRPRLHDGPRPHRRRPGRPPGEPLGHPGHSWPTTGAATTSSTTATSSASTATPTCYTARVGAIYGPGTETVGVLAPGGDPGHRRAMVLDGDLTRRRADRLPAPLPHRLLRPDPAAGAALQHLPAGPGRGDRSCAELLGTDPGVLEAPTPSTPAARSGRDRAPRRALRLRRRPARARRRRPAHRTGRDGRLRRPDRRGQVHRRQARHPLLRPRPRGRADRRPRPARRHARLAAPPDSASSPRSRSCSTARSATTSAFARPDATDDEVWAACRAVGIDDLVERLPDGLDTPVHERGVSLSSGERQLLALARAFLARPRVLVLDEATSNLDLPSEATVERALDALLEGRTAIVIAHRLATALRADRIAVVDGPPGGRVRAGHPRRAGGPGRALRRDVRHLGAAPDEGTLRCRLAPGPRAGGRRPDPSRPRPARRRRLGGAGRTQLGGARRQRQRQDHPGAHRLALRAPDRGTVRVLGETLGRTDVRALRPAHRPGQPRDGRHDPARAHRQRRW